MIKVFIANGSEQGSSFVISKDIALVGRDSANEICLKESSVSRKHAKIYRKNDRYYIEDLQSTNGTWVDGSFIKSGVRVVVQEGVPIAVGNVIVSIGKKCSKNRLPDKYSISVQPAGQDGLEEPPFSERRGKQKKELELIYDISVELLRSLDLNELCEKVLDSISCLLNRIDSGFVFLIDRDSGKLKKVASRFKEGTKKEAPRYSRSLVRQVVKKGQAVMMLDTATEDKANLSDSMEKIGVKSVICVPVLGKTGTRGAIYLQSLNVPHGFRKSDLFLLTSLSTPIGLATENALLYSQSKRMEEELQKAKDNLEKEVMNRTSELKKAKDRLEELSITDGLSGLYNYRYLIKSLESELKRAIRYRTKLSLLLMDIDYFKNFNDTYGHLCGDYVIKTVGKILKSKVRATDVVARYGGDELAVMVIESDTKSALEVAGKLKQEIESYAFQWQTKQLSINLSIGLAIAPARGIQEVSDLVEAADRALYQAKRSGRNAVVVFGQDQETAANQKSVIPSTTN
jgi:diguanylate cyclase (GGDEF)-like protein